MNKSYVRFRNKDGSNHHRVELIPVDGATITTRSVGEVSEPLEFSETKGGFGFCLSPDLCFETGVELSITVSTAFKTNDDVSTIYVRDKRRNEQIASIPTYGGLTQEQLAQELKTALESTGLTVKTETVDETYLKLDLINYSSGNITLELIFPYGDLIPENAITVEGNANTTVGSKNYMYANYAVGFCIAPSEKPQIEISCDGATSTTGFVTLDGRFDVYIDDMETPIHTNISVEELYDIYKDGYNGLQIEAEVSDIPIGCEGAADYIIVGPLTDGGYYEVTVNDQPVYSSSRMFRDGGFMAALNELGIILTPLDGDNVELQPSEGTTDRYYDAERGKFVNTSSEYKRISIKATDATYVTNNWTPDANQSFTFDNDSATAHFCLAPAEEICIPTSIKTNLPDFYTDPTRAVYYLTARITKDGIEETKTFKYNYGLDTGIVALYTSIFDKLIKNDPDLYYLGPSVGGWADVYSVLSLDVGNNNLNGRSDEPGFISNPLDIVFTKTPVKLLVSESGFSAVDFFNLLVDPATPNITETNSIHTCGYGLYGSTSVKQPS